MIEALIALALSLLVVFVFNAPAWLMKLATVGGIGFVIYVIIMVIRWLVNR